MFEAKLWDNSAQEVDTLLQKEMLALMILMHYQVVHFNLDSIKVNKSDFFFCLYLCGRQDD